MYCAALLVCCLSTTTVSADEPTWPTVKQVESQPLLAQIKRVSEALDSLGAPLSDEKKKQIRDLANEKDAAKLTARIQELLDELCVVAVDLPKNGKPRVIAAAKPPELVEQGWRTVLVKVCNHGDVTQKLQARSPNAQPLPRSPKDQVESRWMSLAMFDAQPLATNLSGLELEYRILDLWSLKDGERTAQLEFSAGTKPQDWAGTSIKLKTVASTLVSFKVTDEKGEPTMAAFVIRDEKNRICPAQPKRLAPDLFFQQQIYRETGETIRLPAGKYTVICSRGPESLPETQTLTVADKPVTLSYQSKRWIDPAADGWWSGDHHIHAAGCQHYDSPTEGVQPIDMLRQCQGEDLKVGCCLTWGPCFDYQKRFFSAKVDPISRHPFIIRYDVEVSGFGSHQSGHINLLRLKQQIPPGGDSKNHWPTLGLNTLKWAKKQGAVCGPAHSASGLTSFTDQKVEGGKDGPNGLPNFRIPSYNGIGANEFIVDVTHEVMGPDDKMIPALDFISTMNTNRQAEFNMWYHVMNCGFRVRASGETDFPCVSGERVGMGRVYAKLDGKLDFDRWCDSLANGRSYVSDGKNHLLDFTATAGKQKVEMGVNGSEMKVKGETEVTFTVRAANLNNGAKKVPVELVVNGYPVDKQEIAGDGKIQSLTFKSTLKKSSWVAIRIFPGGHTNPIFVLVDDKPIRASKASAEWCLKGVDQCWTSKKGTYRKEEQKDAEEAYEHARKVYKKLIEECEE